MHYPRDCMEDSGQLHALPASPQGNSPLYALKRRLGRPQRQFERLADHKNLQSLSKIVRLLGRPAHSMN